MIAFIAGIMLLAAAVIPAFPFARYEDVKGARPTGSTVCDGTAMVVAAKDWRIYSTADRDIFIHLNIKGEADFVYFVVGTSNDTITVRRAMTYADAKDRYPDPCVYFTEKDV